MLPPPALALLGHPPPERERVGARCCFFENNAPQFNPPQFRGRVPAQQVGGGE